MCISPLKKNFTTIPVVKESSTIKDYLPVVKRSPAARNYYSPKINNSPKVKNVSPKRNACKRTYSPLKTISPRISPIENYTMAKNSPFRCAEKRNNFLNEVLDDLSNSSNKENNPNMLNKPLVTKTQTYSKEIIENDNVPKLHKKPELIDISVLSTPEKSYRNNIDPSISPDLFSEDEGHESPDKNLSFKTKQIEEKYVHRNDRKLLRRVQDGLNGVLPPPSFTVVRLSIEEMLEKINNNKELFIDKDYVLNRSEMNSSTESATSAMTNETMSETFAGKGRKKSLLSTTDLETCSNLKWPHIMEERYYGLQ